jgi:hypothetical protein
VIPLVRLGTRAATCATLRAMKRISRVVVVIAALAGIGVGAAGASGASSSSKCEAGFTESRSPSRLTVSGDTCANARKVASKAGAIAPAGCIKVLDRKGRLGFRKPCVQRSYRCTAVGTDANRALKVTCTRGSKVIRFTY